MAPAPETDRIEKLLDRMTLAEQVSLMSGEDFWNLPAIERLGIGALRVTDGPNGARGGGSFVEGVRSAAFPTGIALGATWNPELVERIGAALAEETRDKGARVLLGPTINLQRGPLNGRNFECYSEDPVLTAELAVAYVTGLQSRGVAATLKHFAANESEIRRTVNSSDVDERTLRELYLLPFERAVRQAGAWAVMSAYNRVNGIHAADHRWLLTEVLRQDWGFDGVVMSDWFGLHSTVEGAVAGLDLEMPGPPIQRGEKLIAAVENGQVPRDTVRAAARNVRRLLQRTGGLADWPSRREVENERPATRALIREAAAEAMVLLKNNGALPLPEGVRVAVIGPNARTARIMGGGSAQLNAYRRVSVWDGLAEALGGERLTFAPGCDNHRFQPVLEGKFRCEWFDNQSLSGEPIHIEPVSKIDRMMDAMPDGIDPLRHSCRISGSFTTPEAGRWRFGLHATGRARLSLDGEVVVEAWEGWRRGRTYFEEGCDPVTAERDLAAGQRLGLVFEFATKPTYNLHFHAFQAGAGRVSGAPEIEAAAEIAARADLTLVCVGRSAEWDTEGWDLPDMRLPGAQDALVEAVAARARRVIVLLQTGGPVEMPWLDSVDAVMQAWYPGQEAGDAIADVLTGRRGPGGRLPQSFPARLTDAPTMIGDDSVYPGRDGHVSYAEGLEIGYRHHAARDIAPLFPFGFGLDYTGFEIGAPALETRGNGHVTVRVPVTNIGERPGNEVVQVYVAPAPAPLPRPKFELKGFAKLALAPGEAGIAEIALGPRDFAYFNSTVQRWQIEAGNYELRIGASAQQFSSVINVELNADTWAVDSSRSCPGAWCS